MKLILSRFALIFVFMATVVVLRAQKELPMDDPEKIPSHSATFTVSGPAGVNISGPTTVCIGGETILKAEGNYESFEWNTGVKDRFLRVREAGTYEVTVTTKGGCKLTTSVTVRMIPCS
jgi:hypothetical protein